MTDEIEAVDSSEEIRQADIIRHVQSGAQGVVVTADCDLAQRKSAEQLHWVPLVTAGSYLASGPGVDALRKELEQLENQLVAGLKKGAPSVSEAALLDLVRAGDPVAFEQFARDASCWHDNDGRIFECLTNERKTLAADLPRDADWSQTDIQKLFRGLQRAAELRSKTPRDVVGQLCQKLVTPPGDIFVVHLPEPHVALLRFVKAVPLGSVKPTIGTAKSYYRTHRLVAPYRFQLTRKLGAMFSDIGLPDAYASNSRASSVAIGSQLKRLFET